MEVYETMRIKLVKWKLMDPCIANVNVRRAGLKWWKATKFASEDRATEIGEETAVRIWEKVSFKLKENVREGCWETSTLLLCAVSRVRQSVA